MSRKLTLEYISNWLIQNRPEFQLNSENIYKDNKTHLTFYHNSQECEEYFQMSWNSIKKGIGCPVCSGHQVGERTSLAYKRPDLISEWHPDNTKTPKEVTCGCGDNVCWICSVCDYGKNKEWIASIKNREIGGSCPSCSGKVISNRNRLSIKFPKISREWDYRKNKDTPDDVSFGCNEKRWWICSAGHKYSSLIYNRTRGQGCKQCADERQESVIATELKNYFIEYYGAEKEYPICVNPDTNRYLPFDIYILAGDNPELNGYYVEVNDTQHYKLSYFHKLLAKQNDTTPEEEFEYQKKKDRMKRKFARKNGAYIEIDLRKIKTTEEAIEYIESKITWNL